MRDELWNALRNNYGVFLSRKMTLQYGYEIYPQTENNILFLRSDGFAKDITDKIFAQKKLELYNLNFTDIIFTSKSQSGSPLIYKYAGNGQYYYPTTQRTGFKYHRIAVYKIK